MALIAYQSSAREKWLTWGYKNRINKNETENIGENA